MREPLVSFIEDPIIQLFFIVVFAVGVVDAFKFGAVLIWRCLKGKDNEK
tara:strand:+ start:115 stop:261 length:147 start_codon:yes stop_codon:yes gene_type:complete